MTWGDESKRHIGYLATNPWVEGRAAARPYKIIRRHIGVNAVWSPAPAGRNTIAHGNAVGTGTRLRVMSWDTLSPRMRPGMTGDESEWVGARIPS